jgi:hypothetical protein
VASVLFDGEWLTLAMTLPRSSQRTRALLRDSLKAGSRTVIVPIGGTDLNGYRLPGFTAGDRLNIIAPICIPLPEE